MSNKNLKSINITFENCDYIKINTDAIAYIELNNITKQVVLLKTKINRIKEYDVVGKLEIGIFVDRLTEKNHYSTLKNTNEENFEDDKPEPEESVKDILLKYKNIIWIDLIYEDETIQKYSVDWKDGSGEQENIGQKNELKDYATINGIENILTIGTGL